MKRGSTCGCTPMMSTLRNPAPVARTASTCLSGDLLDRLGEQLGDEADRSDDQRHDARQRTEPDRLDEQDRDDDRMKRAA